MRYAGPHNFTGAPVPGYHAPQCWLRADDAARALAKAQAYAHAHGFELVVYDCYRPRRAVSAFVEWSQNADERTKRDYYPNVEKRALAILLSNPCTRPGLPSILESGGGTSVTPFY